MERTALRFQSYPTSRITALEFPKYFQDSMVPGMFRSFCHDHYFETSEGRTLMKDVLMFEAPLGLLGRAAERLVLQKHVRRLLERRNVSIRRAAESEKWRDYPG
jgi:ligand-binding SRPBCC domain-containing protein